jgi:hypothetical protein
MISQPTEFTAVTEYWGPIASVTDTLENGKERHSIVYGFETFTKPYPSTEATISETSGAVFGYVSTGTTLVFDATGREPLVVTAGEYFSVPAPVQFKPVPETRIVAVHTTPFTPLRQWGGPIEPKGRLRYIDQCSDTLLISPPRYGDPCLNLLHFPPGIHQTAHTHPSIRCGAIARGSGYCIDGNGTKLDLLPGMIWIIPAETVHSFHTADSNETMDVIAFHPDSDYGPQDETHPMINRTWVDGTKIDNTTSQHANADILIVE